MCLTNLLFLRNWDKYVLHLNSLILMAVLLLPLAVCINLPQEFMVVILDHPGMAAILGLPSPPILPLVVAHVLLVDKLVILQINVLGIEAPLIHLVLPLEVLHVLHSQDVRIPLGGLSIGVVDLILGLGDPMVPLPEILL